MGARLFLGAEVTDGMDENGTMRYTLRRPIGGHGKVYVDVIYLDDDLLITKGNKGTIHVMVKSNSALAPKDTSDNTTTSNAAFVDKTSSLPSSLAQSMPDDNNAMVVTEDDETSSSRSSDNECSAAAAAAVTPAVAPPQPPAEKQQPSKKRKASDSTTNSTPVSQTVGTAASRPTKRTAIIPSVVGRRCNSNDYAVNINYSNLSAELEPSPIVLSQQQESSTGMTNSNSSMIPSHPVLSCDSQTFGDGVSNIMRSVEAFFGVDMF